MAQPFPAAVYLWLSPGFPVGAFAYSHGLEWAIGAGRVASADDLATWLSDLVAHGSARNDLIFAALAYRRAGVDAELRELLDLAVAMQPGAERRAETINQGNAFAAAIRSAWPCREMDLLANLRPGEIAYPVALGVAAAAHAQPLTVVLNAYGLSFVANMVSAAQRLSLIGQTDGQRVLARLTDTIACAASAAIDADIEDLASAAFVSDLASLLHETSDQRMFRT